MGGAYSTHEPKTQVFGARGRGMSFLFEMGMNSTF